MNPASSFMSDKMAEFALFHSIGLHVSLSA